jgi:hypothetical protein
MGPIFPLPRNYGKDTCEFFSRLILSVFPYALISILIINRLAEPKNPRKQYILVYCYEDRFNCRLVFDTAVI